jgi:hypothetical protein
MTTWSTIGVLLAGPSALDIVWKRTAELWMIGSPAFAQQVARSGGRQPSKGTAVSPTQRPGSAASRTARLAYSRSRARTGLSFDLLTAIQAALSSREMWHPVMARIGLQRTLHTLCNGIVLPYTRPHIELLDDHSHSLVSDAAVINT